MPLRFERLIIMQTTAGHPDNEAAMLLLGLYDQGPQESSMHPTTSDITLSERPPMDYAVVDKIAWPSSPPQRSDDLIASHLDIAQQMPKDVTSTPTLKRKRTSSPYDVATTEGPTPGPSSRTRPDLPHFMGFDNQLYRCICQTTIEPDAGTSIQCESCLAWQHAGCFGLREQDLEGHSYFCQFCSGKDESHQPDLRYVEYIQHLASSKDTISAEPTVLLEEPLRDGKRSRLLSSTTRGGKGRVRLGGTIPKSVDAEGVDRKPMPHSIEGAPAVAPRNQRKKSIINPRNPKGKITPSSNLVTEDIPRDVVGNDIGSPHILGDSDCPLRLLDYIPIPTNLVTSREVEEMLHQPWMSRWPTDAMETPRLVSRTVGHDRPEPGFGNPVDTVASPDNETKGKFQNANVLVKVVAKTELADPVAITPVGLAIPAGWKQQSYEADSFGVYARRDLETGSFIGEFRGEVYPGSEYERDTANQYAILGIPKAFVRRVGPPFGLVVDARRYGTDMRFIRSSCHPNARLSAIPTKVQSLDGSMDVSTSTSFGVYLTKNTRIGDEITLPWEWDDHHVIHELREPSHPLPYYAQRLAAIGRQLSKSFTACACSNIQSCAMAKIISYSVQLDRGTFDIGDDRPTCLGPLIGSHRHWHVGHHRSPNDSARTESSLEGLQHDRVVSPVADPVASASYTTYELQIWLNREDTSCEADNDGSSSTSSPEQTPPACSLGSLRFGSPISSVSSVSSGSTSSQNANVAEPNEGVGTAVGHLNNPPSLDAGTWHRLDQGVYKDEEDGMSTVSDASTLTEPLAEEPDYDDQLDHLYTIYRNTDAPATADRRSSEDSSAEQQPDVGDDCSADAGPWLSDDPDQADWPDGRSTQPNPDRQGRFKEPYSRFVEPIESYRVPGGDQTVSRHEGSIESRDVAATKHATSAKKRINLTHFMQSSHSVIIEGPLLPISVAASRGQEASADATGSPSDTSLKPIVFSSASSHAVGTDNTPWWKSSIGSSDVAGDSAVPSARVANAGSQTVSSEAGN
jgi:hypothetical protein